MRAIYQSPTTAVAAIPSRAEALWRRTMVTHHDLALAPVATSRQEQGVPPMIQRKRGVCGPGSRGLGEKAGTPRLPKSAQTGPVRTRRRVSPDHDPHRPPRKENRCCRAGFLALETPEVKRKLAGRAADGLSDRHTIAPICVNSWTFSISFAAKSLVGLRRSVICGNPQSPPLSEGSDESRSWAGLAGASSRPPQ
jgi:hypothetical protein